MTEFIELLQEKNDHLFEFSELNARELARIKAGEFSHLEAFYLERDRILDFIHRIDDRIALIVHSMSDRIPVKEGREPADFLAQREHTEQLIRDRDELVHGILEQDLQILSAIEIEKSAIISELRSTRFSKKAISSYHSGERRPQLDEEV